VDHLVKAEVDYGSATTCLCTGDHMRVNGGQGIVENLGDSGATVD
jgi:hypothetical protein